MFGHARFEWSQGCFVREDSSASVTTLFPFAILCVQRNGRTRAALLPSPLLWPLELAVWLPFGIGWLLEFFEKRFPRPKNSSQVSDNHIISQEANYVSPYENHIPSQGDDQIMTWDDIYEEQGVDIPFHAEYHGGAFGPKMTYMFWEIGVGGAPISVLKMLGLLCWFSPGVLWGLILLALCVLWMVL